MLVFSLTSHDSFISLNHLRRVILELTPGSPRPMVLVGNKADLVHAREVSDEEIRDLANTWGCDYFEVAAPEPWQVVVRPFAAIYQAVLNGRASH
ncbi:Ras-like protein family member 11B [Portunus trituberculatus]|uniref:small monomeric GTPase n=2 Tax=Portunus trituberculatus TaxID=210409 RepID=A0A5B7H5M0_PORTR|nr:Ras-like protein family member 11B [Portunus trituberculatus]